VSYYKDSKKFKMAGVKNTNIKKLRTIKNNVKKIRLEIALPTKK